jgi:type VI secretion system Hcp family effector
MNRMNSLGRRRIFGLVLTSLFLPTMVFAAAPPVVDSGTGAPAARVVGRITIAGIGQNINVRAFRWGATAAGGAARPVFAEAYVVKAVDNTSPLLMLRLAQGANLSSVVLEVFSPGTTNVLATYELTDARLAAVTDGDPGRSSASGGQPLEELGITYRRVRITSAGGSTTCWDVVNGVAC